LHEKSNSLREGRKKGEEGFPYSWRGKKKRKDGHSPFNLERGCPETVYGGEGGDSSISFVKKEKKEGSQGRRYFYRLNLAQRKGQIMMGHAK